MLKEQNFAIWTNMVQLIRATGYKVVYRTIVLNQSHLYFDQNDYKELNKNKIQKRYAKLQIINNVVFVYITLFF
jgi:hypothetical protein